jgi:hypothetical protein
VTIALPSSVPESWLEPLTDVWLLSLRNNTYGEVMKGHMQLIVIKVYVSITIMKELERYVLVCTVTAM